MTTATKDMRTATKERRNPWGERRCGNTNQKEAWVNTMTHNTFAPRVYHRRSPEMRRS